MSSIAAETRRIVDHTPHLRAALRAGIVNYTEAARQIDVSGETGAVASALRRYAEELPPLEETARPVQIRMERGATPDQLTLAGATPRETDLTAIRLSGAVDPGLLGRVLLALGTNDVEILGGGLVSGTAVVLVPRGGGSRALRLVEAVVGQ